MSTPGCHPSAAAAFPGVLRCAGGGATLQNDSVGLFMVLGPGDRR